MELLSGSGSNGNAADVASLLESMQPFFDAKDNCDEKFLFGYHEKIVVSIYVGDYMVKPTVSSVIKALATCLRTDGASSRTVAQLCSSKRVGDQIFGIFIDTTGNLTAAQKMVVEWSKENCTTKGNLESTGELKSRRCSRDQRIRKIIHQQHIHNKQHHNLPASRARWPQAGKARNESHTAVLSKSPPEKAVPSSSRATRSPPIFTSSTPRRTFARDSNQVTTFAVRQVVCQ